MGRLSGQGGRAFCVSEGTVRHWFKVSVAVGTFLFLSRRFTIHLHRFDRILWDFGANLRLILGRRNIFVPTTRRKREIVPQREWMWGVVERNFEIPSLIGTFLFLSGRFMIDLHRFGPVWFGFGANLRLILGRRNISVPTARRKREIVHQREWMWGVAERNFEI
jgi:hypothetical protein